MNILVTGGAGYIGSHFCKLAKKNGFNPVVLDDLSTGHEKFVKYGPFVKADILDKDAVVQTLRKYKIETVFHFAGKALVGESVEKPDLYFRVNRDGTKSLLEAMNECNVNKLIFSSSCSTYGICDGNISEKEIQRPINPYGQSKLAAEAHVINSGIKSVILRYFNVIGCDPEGELWEDHNPETHIIPNLMKSNKSKTPFTILGNKHETVDGTCVRDFIDVNDLVSVHLEALKHFENKPFVSNIGLGHGYSVLEVLKTFETIFACKIETDFKNARKGDPPYLVADTSFFKSWYKKPLRSLSQTLEILKSNYHRHL